MTTIIEMRVNWTLNSIALFNNNSRNHFLWETTRRGLETREDSLLFSSFFFLPNLPKFTCTSSGRVKVFTFLSILFFSVPKRKRMDSMVKSWVDKLKPCLPKDKAIVIFLHRQPAPLPLLFFPHTLSNVAPTNVTT